MGSVGGGGGEGAFVDVTALSNALMEDVVIK